MEEENLGKWKRVPSVKVWENMEEEKTVKKWERKASSIKSEAKVEVLNSVNQSNCNWD